jgi:hypothetical protein
MWRFGGSNPSRRAPTWLVTEPTRALHVLTGWALDRGEELDALTVTRPSLEDVYLRLTGAEELTHA